jgi:hypothetical protein
MIEQMPSLLKKTDDYFPWELAAEAHFLLQKKMKKNKYPEYKNQYSNYFCSYWN